MTNRYRLPTLHALPKRSRFLTHPFIHFGPEVVYPGDPLRLSPTFDQNLPAGVHARRPPKLPTTLVIRATRFERAATLATSPAEPLKVWGRVFEMYELRDPAQAALAYGTAKVEVEEETGPDLPTSDSGFFSSGSSAGSDADRHPARSRASTQTLPPPFPAHRWRCLTPVEDVTVPFSAVVGRYYPPAPDVEAGVNAIVERVRRTGLVGEGGIKPLALGLSGLVSMGQVPEVKAFNGVRDGADRVQLATEQAARMLFPDGQVPPELVVKSAPVPSNGDAGVESALQKGGAAATASLPASLRVSGTAPAATPSRFMPSSFPSAAAVSASPPREAAPLPEVPTAVPAAAPTPAPAPAPTPAAPTEDELMEEMMGEMPMTDWLDESAAIRWD